MAYSAAEIRASAGDSLDDLHEAAFLRRGCCYLNFPCFRSRRSEDWERIPPSSAGDDEAIGRSWWDMGPGALRSVRGWSGPRRKTFVSRFNRPATGRARATARFQYDPLSYSLNFDHAEPVNRDFSSRYSPIPAQSGRIRGGAWWPRRRDEAVVSGLFVLLFFKAAILRILIFVLMEKNKNSNKSN